MRRQGMSALSWAGGMACPMHGVTGRRSLVGAMGQVAVMLNVGKFVYGIILYHGALTFGAIAPMAGGA